MDWTGIRQRIDEMTAEDWFRGLPAEQARDLIAGAVLRLLFVEQKPGKKTFAAPTVAEVREYCLERKNGVDAEAFVAFYESKGWKVGNQAMKDWKSCIVTWEKRNGKERTGVGPGRVVGPGDLGLPEEAKSRDKKRRDAQSARLDGPRFQHGDLLSAGEEGTGEDGSECPPGD